MCSCQQKLSKPTTQCQYALCMNSLMSACVLLYAASVYVGVCILCGTHTHGLCVWINVPMQVCVCVCVCVHAPGRKLLGKRLHYTRYLMVPLIQYVVSHGI